MDQMGWQKHTVRGFMAGAMKKAGYAVESFKPEGGERTYQLCGAPHNAEGFEQGAQTQEISTIGEQPTGHPA